MEPKGCGSDVSGGTGIHRGSDDSIKQEIGRTLGYCLDAFNMYPSTSYGVSGKEHDVHHMVAEFRDYLENLQSDETLWKNAKSGDLDRLHDAWSEVLTQIDKGKKARVAAASKVRQILKNCATSPTS